jgi:hypothetical protein
MSGDRHPTFFSQPFQTLKTHSPQTRQAPTLLTILVRVNPRMQAGLLLLGVALAFGCQKESQASTTLPQTWRNPELPKGAFHKILVIGIGRNDENRRLYESTMARALAEEGAAAEPSWSLFPSPGKLDRAEVLRAVEERGFDGVIIARLRHVKEDAAYVAAAPMYSSDLYMSGYDEKYAVNSSPAHYEKRKTYQVETTLYSVRDETLAWVGVSDTVNPKSVEDIIASVCQRIVTHLKTEGLIGQRSAAP